MIRKGMGGGVREFLELFFKHAVVFFQFRYLVLRLSVKWRLPYPF